jgi:hypothetical protein
VVVNNFVHIPLAARRLQGAAVDTVVVAAPGGGGDGGGGAPSPQAPLPAPPEAPPPPCEAVVAGGAPRALPPPDLSNPINKGLLIAAGVAVGFAATAAAVMGARALRKRRARAAVLAARATISGFSGRGAARTASPALTMGLLPASPASRSPVVVVCSRGTAPPVTVV